LLNAELIEKFEKNLDPQHCEDSPYFSKILGYGEISTVFELDADKSSAYKRMPLFSSMREASDYVIIYNNYCKYLKSAGLTLPEDNTKIIPGSGELLVLYIIQDQLPPERFAHQLIHTLPRKQSLFMLNKIISQISKVWIRKINNDHIILALDGQLSNWVWMEDGTLIYVDTSTPLYKLHGKEQLNPELFLKSTPVFLRWLIRWLFLKDVMERYYDIRQVYIDLAANLYKENSEEFIPHVLKYINNLESFFENTVTIKEVKNYYQEDKIIWILFMAFRRFDSWLHRRIIKKKYEFILPGKIKR